MNAEHLLTHFDRIANAPDAIPRLRRFILDLAVRGKLVEQNPNDEPASELLKRIAAEKARLVKAGEIQKPPQMPLIDCNSSLFGAPPGWAWARLLEISRKIHYGFTASANQQIDNVRLLRITDIQHNKVEWRSVPGCEIDKKALPSFKLETGDILIARTGGTIGKSFLVVELPVVAVFASYLIRVQGSHEIYARYLKLFLESPIYWTQLREGARGAGQPNVNGQTLGTMLVPLPPFAEQHRIVAKADELMALCDRLEAAHTERETTRNRLASASLARLNAPDPDPVVFRNDAAFALDNLTSLTTRPDQIKALRQTILNLAVRGKLVEQNPNDEPASMHLKHRGIAVPSVEPFELPVSWIWANVGAVADARLGKMLDKAKNKGTPRKYLRNINVRWFDFDLSNLLEMRFEDLELPEFALRFGDVMICEGGEPGRAAVWDARETDIYFQKAIHRVRFLDFVDSEFFVKTLRASADDGRLAEYFTGTGIKHFTGKGLATYLFPLPPLAEQRRIVAKVDELMTVCDRLEASLAAGDETRGRLVEAVLYEVLKQDGSRQELAC